MCGITGVFGLQDSGLVARMTTLLQHRGPDGSGIQVGTGGALGHTRLAIIDLEGGIQPMTHDGALICFNGEIYNYRALAERYLRGQHLATRSDTEVIVQLYRLFGPSCVALLDGMFAFAILDQGELFLARDPLGIKPLYYTPSDSTIFFASELKALQPVAHGAIALSPGSWYHTASGVHCYYTVGQGWPIHGRYRHPHEAFPALRSILRQAVHKRLLADVPVGVSLSGGLDSSIIALLAAQEASQPIETFAVGMDGSADLAAARQVAAYLGTQHHEYIYTHAEIESALPEIVYLLESADPALVRSAIPNYFLARLVASRGVKVILTGEGADELYAGYDYMRSIQQSTELQQELIFTIRELHRTNLQRTDRMFMAFGVEGRVPFLDRDSVAFALSLPPAWKQASPQGETKQLLRDAFRPDLPAAIISRPKQKFSSGAGSSHAIRNIAEQTISDTVFAHEQRRIADEWGVRLANKEALYYHTLLSKRLAERWFLPTMGVSRSL